MHIMVPISFRESRNDTIDPGGNRAILRFPGDESLQVQLGQNLLAFPTNPHEKTHIPRNRKKENHGTSKVPMIWVGIC